MKKLGYSIIALALLVLTLALWRFEVLTAAFYLVGQPQLDARQTLGEGARWFDDYYSVVELDEQTFAIAETRYWQKNYNYLLLGDERAVLFDAGPGIRDIHPVVASLTDLPLTFIPSHFHYDHVGNTVSFDHTAIVDLPYLRERADGNLLELKLLEHLGRAERYAAPTFNVTEWLPPGSEIDLGGRQITVVHTPGHTSDGVTLVDKARGYAFTGDFLYLGPLFAFLPNSRLGDYLKSTVQLLSETSSDTRFFGAHLDIEAVPDDEPLPLAPELGVDDVRQFEKTLLDIKSGKSQGVGFYPLVFSINDKLTLWTNPHWMHDWQPVEYLSETGQQ